MVPSFDFLKSTIDAVNYEKIEKIRELAREKMVVVDSAHDFSHVLRVYKNALLIAKDEECELRVLLPAVLLHDLCNYAKDHPLRAKSGEESKKIAAVILESVDYPREFCEKILYCIENHSFSKGVVPTVLEAKILQDADKLDAIGAIGIARTFAVSGRLLRQFYDEDDPLCEQREADDTKYGLDHFFVKLLRLKELMHTETAKKIADERIQFMHLFLEQLRKEI